MRGVFCLLLLSGLIEGATGEPWTLQATTSRTALWVGDRFEYVVRVEHRPELEFVGDHLKKEELNLQPFEVLNAVTSTGISPRGLKYFELRLELTTFAVNAPEISIPPITLFYFRKGQAQNKEDAPAESLHVPAFPMAVRNTVLDLSQGIRDGMAPLIVNRMAWLIPSILGFCGLAAIAIVGGRLAMSQIHSGFWKRKRAELTRKKSLTDSMQEIRRTPADTAEELESFYNKASDILRGLAAEKLGDGAGLTPLELKNELVAAGDSERHASGLSELLAQCEIIRYAPDGMQQARDRHSEFLSKFEALTERH
ncbi:MAG: hypothetical protein JWO48_3227 [Bryobacterales bacterium]|nr:hypothetical protein [Bryobacterales bacterium]